MSSLDIRTDTNLDAIVPAAAGPTGGLVPAGPLKVLAICDSESYLKWACQTLDAVRAGSSGPVKTHVVVVKSPIQPAPEQIRNATAGTRWEGFPVPTVLRTELAEMLQTWAPDVVLAAATGPVVQQVFGTAARLKSRPALVSGLPGIGLPATLKGIRYRRLGDVFIAHSPAEANEYERVIERLGLHMRVVVTRLPMLTHGGFALEPHGASGPVASDSAVSDLAASGHSAADLSSEAPRPDTLVFAPQAKVPQSKEDRVAILRALIDFKRGAPGRRVVVKTRSRKGEHETHYEEFTYVSLIDELVTFRDLRPGELEVEVGPMADFLVPGAGLVTVSSTAALESLDRGVPTLVIDEFGLTRELLNEVFTGSGVTGSLDAVRAGAFGAPNPSWMAENYFHTAESVAGASAPSEIPSGATSVGMSSIPSGASSESAAGGPGAVAASSGASFGADVSVTLDSPRPFRRGKHSPEVPVYSDAAVGSAGSPGFAKGAASSGVVSSGASVGSSPAGGYDLADRRVPEAHPVSDRDAASTRSAASSRGAAPYRGAAPSRGGASGPIGAPNLALVLRELAMAKRTGHLPDRKMAARLQDLQAVKAEVRTLSPDWLVRAYRRARRRLK